MVEQIIPRGGGGAQLKNSVRKEFFYRGTVSRPAILPLHLMIGTGEERAVRAVRLWLAIVGEKGGCLPWF